MAFLNGVKRTVDYGYAKDTVALTQAAANAASADYTVADLIALIDAAQEGRPAVSSNSIGGATSTLN